MAESARRRLQGQSEDAQDGRGLRCSICSIYFPPEELEGHICLEHLDYFPYSCGHCGHFFATDQLAHFHANKKNHLPIKIREHPDIHKEEQLEQLTADQRLPEPMMATECNSNSPGSSLRDLSQRSDHLAPSPVDFSLDKVETEPTEQDEQNDDMMVTEDEVMLTGDATAQLAANEVCEVGTELPRGEDQVGFIAQPGSDWQKVAHQCSICKVVTRSKMAHAQRHFNCQNNFACSQCVFSGTSANSVRTHISWRHKHMRPQDGVRKMGAPMTFEEMFDTCFGVKPNEKEKEQQDLAALEEPPPINNYCGLGKLVQVDEEERQFVRLVVQMPSDRKYKHLICQVCEMAVCDAIVSIHIFQVHIKQSDMVKCAHCDFGSTYNPKPVRTHSRVRHPKEHHRIIDRRQESSVQEIYNDWRQRCFPLLKGTCKKQCGVTYRKAAPVMTPIKKLHPEAERQLPRLAPKDVHQQQAGPQPVNTHTKMDAEGLLLTLPSCHGVLIAAEVGKGMERSSVISARASEMCFSPISWCRKCSVGVLRSEVDDHIWFAHLGGVLPYRCSRCQRFFITIEAMERHWSSDHGRTPSLWPLVMEVDHNLLVEAKFNQEMATSFP